MVFGGANDNCHRSFCIITVLKIMNNWEIKFVKYFNSVGGKKLDTFLGFVNSIRFLAFFWIFVVLVAIISHPQIARDFFWAVFLVAVLHFGITEGIIKSFLTYLFFKRSRPYVAFPKMIKPIGKKFSDSSFPSSHMTTTVGMFFVICTFFPSLLIPAIVFVLAMAFSRLHNGMHYPSDILVGVILGLCYGYLAIFLL